jgi:DNA segregation ATPase FtsK/SpoIIIE, S-DNA-T family
VVSGLSELPRSVDLDAVRRLELDAPSGRLLLGLDQADLAPVGLDPDTEPHLLVFGEGNSGKSTLLRTLCLEIARRSSPRRAQLVIVDPRRSLLAQVPPRHLATHLTSGAQTAAALTELAAYLASRLPGPELSARQLEERTWWQGAEVFLIVDDYDLVAASGSPLVPLVPFLAQARDVGLHLLLARRSNGAARVLHDPVVRALLDLGAASALLSGSPDEGPLVEGFRLRPELPGRLRLITRSQGPRVVQVARDAMKK